MASHSAARSVTVVMALMLCSAGQARAQSNAEVNAGIQFDFSQPGARSLGLGGAFVAVADDATAAWANPAGLRVLSKPEVSGEARSWTFSNFITDRGHAFGAPTGIGADTTPGLVDGPSTDRTGSPAFLSFVYPGPHWSVAFYRHQLSNFKARVSSSGPFLNSGTEVDRVDPFVGDLNLTIVDYGAAIGYQVNDRLSLGAGVGLHDFDMRSRTDRYLYVPLSPPPAGDRGLFSGTGQRFGAPDFSANNVLFTNAQSGSDQSLAFTGGLLYRAPRWNVGAAFRQGPDFAFKSTLVAGPASPRATPTGGVFSVGQLLDEEVGTFKVPDVFAVGAAFRPADVLTVSVEYDRVQYSQLTDKNVEVLGIEENNPGTGAALGQLINNNLKFPDTNQLRGGLEYSLVQTNHTLLFRFGAWYDPDHRMRFESPDPRVARLAVLFRPGQNEVHFAPGFGVATSKFQIDAAFDVSERINTVAVSTVFRF